jgi:hypothetical protein
MKTRLSLILFIMALLYWYAPYLQAQVGDGEVNTSDQALEKKDEPADDMKAAAFVSILGVFVPSSSNQQKVEYEAGAVFTGYSDVQIPGDEGTLFSLSDDLKAKTAMANRVRLSKRFGSRHNISLLAALLNVKSTGEFVHSVNFAGKTFGPNVKTSGYYWFNSYRLTYRYDFINTFTSELGIGITAKLREAGIRLENNHETATKANVGFVPIINFRYDQYLGYRFNLLVEGDALAAPQGRAEDIYAGVTYKVADWARLKLGYRILEGGADVKETYNFALFHYATAGVEFGY